VQIARHAARPFALDDQLTKKPINALLDERQEKFRKTGKVFEG
jgi:hypothetical protein